MKFKVGDRVRCRGDEYTIGTITHVTIGAAVCPYDVTYADGKTFGTNEADLVLVEAVPAKEPGPQEPMPIIGKLYKSPAGNKLQYVGLCRCGYVFESVKSGTLYIFQQHRFNDMSEWTAEVVLPAMEIKRWSLICNEDYKHWKRGEFRFADNSVQEIEKVLNVYVEKEERKYWEIIELTGTLPERKQINQNGDKI